MESDFVEQFVARLKKLTNFPFPAEEGGGRAEVASHGAADRWNNRRRCRALRSGNRIPMIRVFIPDTMQRARWAQSRHHQDISGIHDTPSPRTM